MLLVSKITISRKKTPSALAGPLSSPIRRVEFCGERKTGEPREKPSGLGVDKQQTQYSVICHFSKYIRLAQTDFHKNKFFLIGNVCGYNSAKF